MPRKRCNRCRQFGLSFGRGIWQITVTLTDITCYLYRYSFLFSRSSSFFGKWRYYLAARSSPISFWFAVKASSRVCNTRKTAVRLRNIVWKIRLHLSKKEIETSNAPLLEKWPISFANIPCFFRNPTKVDFSLELCFEISVLLLRENEEAISILHHQYIQSKK